MRPLPDSVPFLCENPHKLHHTAEGQAPRCGVPTEVDTVNLETNLPLSGRGG
jgi:hypothetical protein